MQFHSKMHIDMMYFCREYSGVEVDIVLEDYKKNYTTIEVKVDEHKHSKDIFPLDHTFTIINSRNCYEKISEILQSFKS